MKYKNVIFDMDGVLIDNSEGIMHCARYAIAGLGMRDPGEATLRRFIGPALVWSLKTYCGATEEQAMRGLTLYREKYLAEGIKMFRLYDGIGDAVKILYERGVRLSVSSGKPIDCVNEILEVAGLAQYFEVTAGTVFPAKVSSKDEQLAKALLERPAVAVGDRIFDLECAHRAGIDCIFAKYGFGDESDYAELKPAYFVDRPSEIVDIVLQ